MRSCMYCGKDLKEGEVCSCAGAQARRASKGSEQKTENSTKTPYDTENNGYYRTGYTQNDGRIKQKVNRFKTKRAERRNRVKQDAHGIFSDLWSFIKSPVNAVSNPKNFSQLQMTIIAAVQGAIIGMGIYFVMTGASRSWFGFLANIIGFRGISGYKMMMNIILSAAMGAVGGIVMFYIYTGVMFAVGKLLFRSYTSFTAFMQRLILTNIPFTFFAAVGVLFALVSTTSLMILLLCGIMSSFVLTYVSLCNEWSAHSESKILYGMLIGYFILFTLICSLLRISVIGG